MIRIGIYVHPAFEMTRLAVVKTKNPRKVEQKSARNFHLNGEREVREVKGNLLRTAKGVDTLCDFSLFKLKSLKVSKCSTELQPKSLATKGVRSKVFR